MASIPKSKTTNKQLFDTINDLRKYSSKSNVGTWKAVAAKLAGSASQRAQVNLSKIEKHAKAGETIVIPGKVLGDGTLTKKVTIIAFRASASAIAKIEKAGGKFITLSDYVSKSPKDKPRIIG